MLTFYFQPRNGKVSGVLPPQTNKAVVSGQCALLSLLSTNGRR